MPSGTTGSLPKLVWRRSASKRSGSFLPSVDISAAWEAVHKIFKGGWDLDLYYNSDKILFPYEVRCFHGADKRIVTHGKTMPHAICKAVLLSIMEE